LGVGSSASDGTRLTNRKLNLRAVRRTDVKRNAIRPPKIVTRAGLQHSPVLRFLDVEASEVAGRLRVERPSHHRPSHRIEDSDVCRVVYTTSIQVYCAQIAGACKESRWKTVVKTRILILINIVTCLICSYPCLELAARRGSAHLIRVS